MTSKCPVQSVHLLVFEHEYNGMITIKDGGSGTRDAWQLEPRG